MTELDSHSSLYSSTSSNFLLFIKKKKKTKAFKVYRFFLCPVKVLMENKLRL